jgi:hypothetical protein
MSALTRGRRRRRKHRRHRQARTTQARRQRHQRAVLRCAAAVARALRVVGVRL